MRKEVPLPVADWYEKCQSDMREKGHDGPLFAFLMRPMPSAFRFYQKAWALRSHCHPYSVIDATSSLCLCWVTVPKHCPPSTLCSWGFMKAYVAHWKSCHCLKVELYFVWQKFLGLHALETASQVTLKELLQGGVGRSHIIQKFYNTGQIALNIKCMHV